MPLDSCKDLFLVGFYLTYLWNKIEMAGHAEKNTPLSKNKDLQKCTKQKKDFYEVSMRNRNK